eukprot:15364998-Ditylum_brightwellii.AAC.1
MKLVCFPWAGGSSALYSPWKSAHGDVHSTLANHFGSEIYALDYPGRATRFGEETIHDMSALVEDLLKTYNKVFFRGNSSRKNCVEDDGLILFGHSFGALVAFEIAKHLSIQKAKGQAKCCPILAVFVSASKPPHHPELVTTSVSMLGAKDICNYFATKGNPVSPLIVENEELLSLFLQNVRADYSCMESYKISDYILQDIPLFVAGGRLDPGISLDDLNGWTQHSSRPMDKKTNFRIYDHGHFFLNDKETMNDLSLFIIKSMKSLKCISEQIATNYANDNEVDPRKIDPSIVEHVTTAFCKALDVPNDFVLSPTAHFFNELGGTSLDTMVLRSHLQTTLDIDVTQNEFFLNPTINTLCQRIQELRRLSLQVPKMEPIDPNCGENGWFPAAAQQEQMVSLWEAAPTMYNMPTTIEFHGTLHVDILERAFVHVIEQQPMLRSVVHFKMSTNEVKQKIIPASLSRQCLDFVVIEAEASEARSIIEKESGYIFHLDRPPVIRGVLVKTQDSNLLLLNQHHVGADGWSRTQLRRQLLKAYLALKNGKSAELIPKHPSYLDWTIYSKKWLHDFGQQEKQLSYWRNQLEDLPALEMPLDFKRPSVLSSRGVRIPVRISKETTLDFGNVMAQANSNLFVGLLSLYMSLLHRWSGNDKFAIGVAMANRHHKGLEHLVGYFANEVAIVADFAQSEHPSFNNFLGKVRRNVLDAMANADVAFHHVCEALNVQRDASQTSIFQAMFALQEQEWHSVEDLSPSLGEDELTFNLKQYNHNTSKFEVHLQLRHDGKGGLEGDFHVATDLFTKETGERLVEAYILLMKSCIKKPDIPIAAHSIMPEHDKEVIKRCNNTRDEYDESDLWSRIEVVPDVSTAFIAHNAYTTPQIITYGELKKKAIKVSQFLQSRLNSTSQRIGVLVKNSYESIVLVLGIYLAHCTSVIVDVEKTPANRAIMIFKDAQTSLIFILEATETLKFLEEDFDVVSWQVLEMDHTEIQMEKFPCKDLTRNCPIDFPFSIFYTSGTTGLPKGVVIELHNREDRILLFSSLSFIMSLRQWVPTLCAGATVVLPASSLEFENAILESGVNKLVCTPSALAALDTSKVKNVRMVQVAGEPPQFNTMAHWKSMTEKLFIGLGPTELCAHALSGEFDGEVISIGNPAGNVRAYVVDKNSNQVPLNVVGELWVAGENVSNGYLNREEENNAHFSVDPFHSDGARLYKTGDLCKRLPDGRIQFIGRRDKQIKLNGFRIEIGDIQSAMPKEVKNSLIMIQNSQLVAYVMPKVKKSLVIDALARQVPRYMVPSSIIPIDNFPLNKNRKIDSAELMRIGSKVLEEEQRHAIACSSSVLTQTQDLVAMFWAEVLCRDVAGLTQDSNFFASGGTSLSAVVLSRKLKNQLSVNVSVQDVFQYQTIASFALYIGKSNGMDHCVSPDPLLFLPGGEKAMAPKLFAIAQLIGLVIMSIIVTIPLLATVYVAMRLIIWFGTVKVVACKAPLSFYSVIHVSTLYTWVFDETPMSSFWLRALGASVGKNTSLEQPYILEPDLVNIGNDCVLEFETQLNTSEIKKGILEFRQVIIGDRVKIGVRSVLLGGTKVGEGCEILAKSALDLNTSFGENMMIQGAPAKVAGNTNGEVWQVKTGCSLACLQIIGMVIFLAILALITFVGATIGLSLQHRFGSVAMVVYLGASALFKLALHFHGINHVSIRADAHLGMLSYFSTERKSSRGVSFWPINIEEKVSIGQRCVFLSGANLEQYSTVGAETVLPHDYFVYEGGTAFGSPPVFFRTSVSEEARVAQTQEAGALLNISNHLIEVGTTLGKSTDGNSEQDSEGGEIGRRQDIGKGGFWTYVLAMIFLQSLMPVALGSSYGFLFYVATIIFDDLSITHIILSAPAIYIIGSLMLMLFLKVMQMLGGSFSIGTSNFFSFHFFYWHIFADMFREIDFLNIGDDCVLMTPNIHAHYTDNGQLQFCPVLLEDRVEINFGATVMPLTQYQKGCCLRPHSVTVKGQICEADTEYYGNPCKGLYSQEENKAAILFPGQGSQYPGMLENVKDLPAVKVMLIKAEEILGWNVLEYCGKEADAKVLNDTRYAQPLMFLAGLAHAEWMKKTNPLLFSNKIKAVSGFSLGEVTALCFAGAISFEDALEFVKIRSNIMARCNGGSMVSLIGLSLRDVKALCKKTGCTVANLICHHNKVELIPHNVIVCAGSKSQVANLLLLIEKIPGKFYGKQLRVSGAFHSNHMSQASRDVKIALGRMSICMPTKQLVLSNVTGRPYQSSDEIQKLLIKQIVEPVQWHKMVEYLVHYENIRTFVECGSMSVLTKTLRSILHKEFDDEGGCPFNLLSSDNNF